MNTATTTPPTTCFSCGAHLTREDRVGWVDARDGGYYDLCTMGGDTGHIPVGETVVELAERLDVAPGTVAVLLDDLHDDYDMWCQYSETVLPAGAEAIAGAILAASEDAGRAHELEQMCQELREAEEAADYARTHRDRLIRTLLGEGMSYRLLGEVTGLGRARLDTIRRAGL